MPRPVPIEVVLSRVLRRLTADPHVLLAVAIALSALVIVLVDGSPRTVLVPLSLFLLAQMGITLLVGDRRRTEALDTARLLLALAAVWGMNLRAGDPTALPLTSLYLPIVAMSAALGRIPTIIVTGTAIVAYLGPALAMQPVDPALLQRGVALVAAMIVVVVGSRRTVVSLERALDRARQAMAGQRRRARQMAAIEAVGRVLATAGPTTGALTEVVDVLVDRFGYRYVSVYTLEGDVLRLGAQRGYAQPVETFAADQGVLGRVLRTGQVAFVKDTTADPDYHAADPAVRSEVSVPLLIDGRVAGVLSVESVLDAPLDEADRDTVVVVGDRIAAALALAREREALQERAALFTRLADLGMAINGSLDQATARGAIVDAVATALQADTAVLVVRDPGSGDDRIVAIHGGDERYVGVRIPAGEGLAGRAIAGGRIVSQAEFGRSDFASTVRGARSAEVLAGAAVPIVGDEGVLGALTVARVDLSRPFSPLELEGLGLIATQVGLALRNLALHAQVADAAIRDPLTGLWNRRHLDEALAHAFAARARLDPELRRPISAIIFDLDHFGRFNKEHGHAVGDQVIRAFAAILRERVRASDHVARFGGEEFVAFLDGATLDEAIAVAEEIRRRLEAVRVAGADGRELRATVSAGCAALGPEVNSYDTLLEVADVALQMAKRAGRNQVVAA
jgi:diguanylate cyclase (GGDEF)-like protein